MRIFAATAMLFSFAGLVRAQDNLTVVPELKGENQEEITLAETTGTYTASDVPAAATLALSSAEGAKIYYTTDGSNPVQPSDEVVPTAENATIEYVAAIELNQLTAVAGKITIKAQAFKAAAEPSAKASETESDVITIELTMAETPAPADLTLVPSLSDAGDVEFVLVAGIYGAQNVPAAAKVMLTGSDAAAKIYYSISVVEPEQPELPGGVLLAAKEDEAGFVAYPADGIALTDLMGEVTIKAVARVENSSKATATESDTITIKFTMAEPVYVFPPYFTIGDSEEAVYGERNVLAGTKLFIRHQDENAVIYYTDKSVDEVASITKENGTLFDKTQGIEINDSCTIRAKAFIGEDASSDAEEAVLKLNVVAAPDTVSAPVFSYYGGLGVGEVTISTPEYEIPEGYAITITSATEVATVRYTFDEDAALESVTDGLAYDANNRPSIDTVCTLRARAFAGDKKSEITAVKFTIKAAEPEKPSAPIFVPAGDTVVAGDTILVAASDADSICVAVGDAGFVQYAGSEVKLAVGKYDTLFRAYAVVGTLHSDIVTARYFVMSDEEPEPGTVAAPTFSLNGEVNAGDTLRIDCATEGAEIFYAMDTAAFVAYTDGIVITKSVTVKAYAKKDTVVSDTTEVSLIVKGVSVEDRELAGVSVYPNPSNGRFNVSVPVNATVEVFASNGRLVRRQVVMAGETAMELDQAGIYFVRVAAEGQVAISKVVVR